VGQHVLALRRLWIVLTLIEREVVADRERAGVDRLAGRGGLRAGMNPHVAERLAHTILHRALN